MPFPWWPLLSGSGLSLGGRRVRVGAASMLRTWGLSAAFPPISLPENTPLHKTPSASSADGYETAIRSPEAMRPAGAPPREPMRGSCWKGVRFAFEARKRRVGAALGARVLRIGRMQGRVELSLDGRHARARFARYAGCMRTSGRILAFITNML